MCRPKIENLAEHYLRGMRFNEACSNDRNRFLDEVVRRYAREANKKYAKDETYLLFCTKKLRAGGGIDGATLSVLKCFPWTTAIYKKDGRRSRVGDGDVVGTACLASKLCAISINYSCAGILSDFSLTINRGTEVTDRLILETKIDKITDSNEFNYELSGFVKPLTREECKNLKLTVIPCIAESAPFESFLNKLNGIVGVELMNSITPETCIINAKNVIEYNKGK